MFTLLVLKGLQFPPDIIQFVAFSDNVTSTRKLKYTYLITTPRHPPSHPPHVTFILIDLLGYGISYLH